jgi:site-specific recombinase XerD
MGSLRLGSIRTVEVEEWLHSLPLTPASKSKLKCVLSVLNNHAIRYQWLTFNSINRVRTSQRRLRDKDILTPEEFQKLVQQLSVRDRAMVLLIGSTGLRRSEMIALTVGPQHQNYGGQCLEVLRAQPLREDEDRVVPTSSPTSSACAQRFVRVACAIVLCYRRRFSVSLSSIRRE